LGGIFLKAIESRSATGAAMKRWISAFTVGAEKIPAMGGTLLWHPELEFWGFFGTTRRGGTERVWNTFGHKLYNPRGNMIVEINVPPEGANRNVQGVFAKDDGGRIWILHQGRMSVPGSRVTQADFIAATGLKPVPVTFRNGSTVDYHKVASLEAPPQVLQTSIAAWVTQCTRARAMKGGAGATDLAAIGAVQDWELGLSPESTGLFKIAARVPAVARRRHGEVWKALSALLRKRKVPHSNDRVSQYGPDLFTYGGRNVLFEIKSDATAQDVFQGVGQLHVYEQLLSAKLATGSYRKVLVLPAGMRKALEEPLKRLGVIVLPYQRQGGKVEIEESALRAALG
jgi:hypothetical protein